MLTNKHLTERISLLDKLIDTYNNSKEKSSRDFSAYENNYLDRLKKAISFFQELTDKAVDMTVFHKETKFGRPEILTLKQRVKILLIQKFINKSNREMSEMLMLFAYLQDIDISYKTIERLYDGSLIDIRSYWANAILDVMYSYPDLLAGNPPIYSNLSPTGNLSAGTTSTNLSLTTNVQAVGTLTPQTRTLQILNITSPTRTRLTIPPK